MSCLNINMDVFNKNKHHKKCLFFTVAIFVVGFIDGNYFIQGNGIGLLEHVNIWGFIIINFTFPFIITYNLNALSKRIQPKTSQNINKNIISKKQLFQIVYIFFRIIGLCFWVGNSLQNAGLINDLPMDFWDSTTYIYSYLITRLYKLYLFCFFFPEIFILIFRIFVAISQELFIPEDEMRVYPIKRQTELNFLTNTCLNLMFVSIIVLFFLTAGTYYIHQRTDITTTSSVILTLLSTICIIIIYHRLTRKYSENLFEYKRIHINKIHYQLSTINNLVFKDVNENDYQNQIDICLKKEVYFQKTLHEIDKICIYPKSRKAILIITSPAFFNMLSFLIANIENLF